MYKFLAGTCKGRREAGYAPACRLWFGTVEWDSDPPHLQRDERMWTQDQMRRDAERNRQKLIAAASEIMRNEGGDVPMELIAERANLTRGTLYRNFAHRQAMYEAVLEHDLETMTQHLAAERDADPLAFIRHLTELMTVYDKFLVALADMADYDAAKNQARMVQAITAPLAFAQARGLLHARLTGDDILMACRMLASHVRLDDRSDPAGTFKRRLELMMQGLGTPCNSGCSTSQAPQGAQVEDAL